MGILKIAEDFMDSAMNNERLNTGTNDRVRISQVRQRLVSSCQVSVSSCPAQTQEAQYAQKKYSQSCIFKAHIITS